MYPARSPSLSLWPSLGAGPVWTGPAPLAACLNPNQFEYRPRGGTASVPGDGHGRHRSDAGQTGACVFALWCEFLVHRQLPRVRSRLLRRAFILVRLSARGASFHKRKMVKDTGCARRYARLGSALSLG